jgi:hypothetical protein
MIDRVGAQPPIDPEPEALEQCSAYLDGELSPAESRALEARLAEDATLRLALEALRQTSQVLRAAPTLAVPRNFTLDPARFRRPRPWWDRYQRMQAIGAVGTLAAALLIAFGTWFAPVQQPVNAPGASVPSASVVVVIAPTTNSAAALATSPTTSLETSIVMQATILLTATALPSQDAARSMATDGPSLFMATAAVPVDSDMTPAFASTPALAADALPVSPTPMLPNADGGQPPGDQISSQDGSAANESAAEPGPAIKMAEPTASASPALAASPTPSALPAAQSVTPAASARVGELPTSLILGIPLLVLSLMLWGIGWLRSRLK